VVSVLMVYGQLHRMLAIEKLREITTENFEETCTIPLRYLREAAGIFDYISEQVSTKFIVAPNALPIPEIFSESFNLLSTICMAEGQQFIIRKAVIKKTKPLIVSKLCSGIFKKFVEAEQCLQKIEEKSPYKGLVNGSIVEYIQIMKPLYKALTLKYLGIHHYYEADKGVAVSCLNHAYNEIKDINLANTKHDDIRQLWNKFEIEKQYIHSLNQEYNDENEKIFRERIPENKPDMPEHKILVNSIPFEPPESIDLEILRKDGFFCVIQ